MERKGTETASRWLRRTALFSATAKVLALLVAGPALVSGGQPVAEQIGGDPFHPFDASPFD